jgi:hypothetical protein
MARSKRSSVSIEGEISSVSSLLIADCRVPTRLAKRS